MARRQRYNMAGPLKGRGVDPYRPDQSAFHFTPSEARAEYARLRREANRRLDVLRRSEYANMPVVRNRPASYQPLPRNASEAQIRGALFDVARFVGLKTSSLRGQRRATMQTLKTLRDENGLTFLNKNNILDFMRFMDEVNRHKAAKGLPSDAIVDMWRQLKDKRIDTKTIAADFDFWLLHTDEIEKAPRSRSTVTSKELMAKIGTGID